MTPINNAPSGNKAYIVTGPTSGIGRQTALELAKHGTVVLVGRDPSRLAEVAADVAKAGGHAVSVECDFADITSVRRAAAEIIALDLPIAGVLNIAGILPFAPGKSAQGWDLAFATNHVGGGACVTAIGAAGQAIQNGCQAPPGPSPLETAVSTVTAILFFTLPLITAGYLARRLRWGRRIEVAIA